MARHVAKIAWKRAQDGTQESKCGRFRIRPSTAHRDGYRVWVLGRMLTGWYRTHQSARYWANHLVPLLRDDGSVTVWYPQQERAVTTFNLEHPAIALWKPEAEAIREHMANVPL